MLSPRFPKEVSATVSQTAFLLLLLVPTNSSAQSTATLRGTVVDPRKSVVKINRLYSNTNPRAQLNPADFGILNGISQPIGLPQISQLNAPASLEKQHEKQREYSQSQT